MLRNKRKIDSITKIQFYSLKFKIEEKKMIKKVNILKDKKFK